MVGSSEVDLVDWSELFCPFMEFHPAVLLRQLVHIANERKTYDCQRRYNVMCRLVEVNRLPLGPGSF
jgi:hypothetical protein